jgi:hypothetical protein
LDGLDLPSELKISLELEHFRKDLKALTFILRASPFIGSRSRFLESATPPDLDLSKYFDLLSTSFFFGKFINSDPKVLEKNHFSPS